MLLNPDTHDRLTALFKRMDNFPDRPLPAGGAELRPDAYSAWLEARTLIERLRHELFAETKGWRPIDSYFETEPETPLVLLWEPGETIALGYWDDDEQAWYRDGHGADLESEPLQPTKWMALAELMRSAEFVSIPRMD